MRSWTKAATVLAILLALQLLAAIPPLFIVTFFLAPVSAAATPILFNLVLILLFVDAVRQTAPRWLMAIPILFYSVSAASFGIGYAQYLNIKSSAEAANRVLDFAFDPAQMDLVVTSETPANSIMGGALARGISENFAVEGVFEPAAGQLPYRHLVHRIVDRSYCDAIPRPQMLRRANYAGQQCAIHAPDDPAQPVMSVSHRDITRKSAFIETRLSEYRITSPDGRTGIVSTGTAYLRALPVFAAFCAPNLLQGNAPQDDSFNFFLAGRSALCGFIPLKLPFEIGSGAVRQTRLATAVPKDLATALRLNMRAANTPSVLADLTRSEGAPSLSRTLNGMDPVEHASATLEAFLIDPTVKIERDVQDTFKANRDLLTPYADRLADASIASKGEDTASRTRRESASNLLLALLDEPFRAVALKLIEDDVKSLESRRFHFQVGALLDRLADLGPISLPLIGRRILMSPPSFIDFLKLCRIGGSMERPLRDRLLAELRVKSNQFNSQAAYLALLRTGERSAADTALRQGYGPQSPWFTTYADFGPQSPPEDCRTGG